MSGPRRFWPIADLWTEDAPTLALVHEQIVADGVERARAMLEYTSLATGFVEEPFTIAHLRRVYEAWSVPLHPANFRRKVLSMRGFVIPTGEARPPAAGTPTCTDAATSTTCTRRCCDRPLISKHGRNRAQPLSAMSHPEQIIER